MPIDYNAELRLSYLRAAAAAQSDEESKIAVYRDFFEGEQGVELTDRQDDYLTELGDNFDVESFGNICRRVVDVPKDRLELDTSGIAPGDPDAGEYAGFVTDWWAAEKMHARQKSVYEAVLRDGAVAVIVGWNGTRPMFTPNLVYDGATGLVRFHYDSDGNLLYASKRWRKWDPVKMGETGKTRLNLYLPDRIERNIADENVAGGWRILEPAEVAEETGGSITQNPQPWVDRKGEPLGIPVIPFENPNGSELADVITVQKLLNHSLSSFDEAIDLHAWPQLWAAGLDLPKNSSGEPYVPAYGPGQMFTLAADGRMGRIEPADLERMFRAGVLSWLHVLAVVKGWPLFVLDRSAQPPSGVALKIMEAGLIAQVQNKQAVIGGAWLDAFEMGRKLHRFYTGQELTGEIELNWESVETADSKAQAETDQIRCEAGRIPVLQRWRELGYTPAQIEQMIEDKGREDEFGLVDIVMGIEQ